MRPELSGMLIITILLGILSGTGYVDALHSTYMLRFCRLFHLGNEQSLHEAEPYKLLPVNETVGGKVYVGMM